MFSLCQFFYQLNMWTKSFHLNLRASLEKKPWRTEVIASSLLEKPLVWYLIDEAELFPKRVFFVLSWQPRRRIIVPFHVWTLFCSLSFSHCARMSSCILPLGKYWEIGEARSRWVEGNEWTAETGGGKEAAVKYETAAVLIAWEPQLSNLAK